LPAPTHKIADSPGKALIFVRWLALLFRYTLNSVVFGITLMAATGIYIAVGSGFPSVREYFEMTDLQFFNAWPLKLLMLLLCVNLATVTWRRIPLTPPRFGVWAVHCGIITLILGSSLYYHFKFEGRTLIPVNHSTSSYYDSAQRALYVRVLDHQVFGMAPLPSLPRFGFYDAEHDPARLERADLRAISRVTPIGGDTDAPQELSSLLLISQPVHLDIVGFYPYADVVQDVVEDPSSDDVGVRLDLASPHADSSGSLSLTAADPTARRMIFESTELEHRVVSESSLAAIRLSAARLFNLSVALPGRSVQNLSVEPGATYTIPNSGYTITVDAYDPAFPLFGTQDRVAALTMHIVSAAPAPRREFWRMILAGRALQTDFKMDPATTPPMVSGNRQKQPIDKDLIIGFSVDDLAGLLPSQGDQKHTFFTAGDSQMIDVQTSFTGPVQITDLSAGGQIQLPFEGSTITAQARRVNHFRVLSRIVQTPPARRVKDQDDSGEKQVAVVRVTVGDWSTEVPIPCALYAAPDPMTMEPTQPWEMGMVKIPGAAAPLELQLGFVTRPMPAQLTLKKFELVHYPGGQGENGPFLDFRSTLEIVDSNGEHSVEVASNNNPVYFDGGKWIFFQAGYDPQGQFSVIGVGNRPGVFVMLSGCALIVLGVLYAFYVKPIVIRRMKAAALARLSGMPRAPFKEELITAGNGETVGRG
jgi:hypothetical protein